MIRFEISPQGYYVEWDNLPYECLYVVYYPVGNLKRITNGRIEILSDTRNAEYITCPKRHPLKGGHSPLIPQGSYDVRLCTTPRGVDGEVLKEQKVYIGQRIPVRYGLSYTGSGKNEFPVFNVQSDCFIPQNQIWIAYKAFTGEGLKKEIDLGIKVFLPEMRRDEKMKYYTACTIPMRGYRYAKIEVSEVIGDCVQIIKY